MICVGDVGELGGVASVAIPPRVQLASEGVSGVCDAEDGVTVVETKDGVLVGKL